MVAADEDDAYTGMCHNSQCWSRSDVSQLIVWRKKFLPAANFDMKYMHLDAY